MIAQSGERVKQKKRPKSGQCYGIFFRIRVKYYHSMIQKLSVLTVFSVSALFFTTMIQAGQAGIADGAIFQAKSNDKLLLARILTPRQNAFEHGINVRQLIAKNDIMSLQNEIDKKIASQCRGSRAIDSSA